MFFNLNNCESNHLEVMSVSKIGQKCHRAADKTDAFSFHLHQLNYWFFVPVGTKKKVSSLVD